MRTYVCDRRIPYTNEVVIFHVQAASMVDAAHSAGEMAYSVAYYMGALPTREGKHKRTWPAPAAWAGVL